MLSDAIRRRLEQLNRAPLNRAPAEKAIVSSPAANSGVVNSGISRSQRHLPAASNEFPLVRSDDTCSGQRRSVATEFENANGVHLRLRRPLADFFPRGVSHRPHGDPGPGTLPQIAPAHPELLALGANDPRGAMYLDLETCGFAGSMIFLVGLVWWDEGELWLDQLLARNYAEERAMLTTLWQIAAPLGVLVTFNGKSFDWPMVEDRSTLHRLPHGSHRDGDFVPAELLHCDLLHHARRRWRGELPDCRLQTLERSICRRHRSGDVPGALVPAVYHSYVRSGERRVIEPVLHHNALDLVTLVEIGQALLSPPKLVARSA
jgi:uncharacterized protein YprB with RNaseH-like and TPR domain